jgi:hypothetical protein
VTPSSLAGGLYVMSNIILYCTANDTVLYLYTD